MHRFASTAAALGSLAIATLASAPALADCIPGTGLCASAGASVGIPIPSVQVGGQVQVGIPGVSVPVPQVAPQPMPAPQVVVVPGYGYAPPPPVVVYQQPAPRPVYVMREPFWGASRLGLDLRGEGAAGFGANHSHNTYGLGGAGLGFRYRATPHLGVELGVDVLGGRDYNDNKRLEIAGSLGGLLFVNPRSRVQLYFSGGALVDHAKASSSSAAPVPNGADTLLTTTSTTYNHVGGYAGLGLEMFATRRLSFHVDARGVVRQNVSGGRPEFTDSTGRTTNTSGGVVGSAGMVFYF